MLKYKLCTILHNLVWMANLVQSLHDAEKFQKIHGVSTLFVS